MVEKNDLQNYLESLSREYPGQVVSYLNNGNKIQRSADSRYFIDNDEIYTRLGKFSRGEILYEPINRRLKDSQIEIFNLFNNSCEIPFSKLFESGIGGSLEKAILFQLSSQKNYRTYLIKGFLGRNDEFSQSNAYNIVFKNENAFLVDTQNPLLKNSSEKTSRPFIAPILKTQGRNSNFVVQNEWREGRNYSIF